MSLLLFLKIRVAITCLKQDALVERSKTEKTNIWSKAVASDVKILYPFDIISDIISQGMIFDMILYLGHVNDMDISLQYYIIKVIYDMIFQPIS